MRLFDADKLKLLLGIPDRDIYAKWCGERIANMSLAGAALCAGSSGTNGRKVKPMLDDCKWMQDEVCVNADCPACADYCPVANTPGVCKYEERGNSDAQKGKRQTGAK